MKIRDTNAYIRNIIKQENIVSVLGSPVEDRWLIHCYGGDTDIKENVKQISKFAQNFIRQIVYEFIQNADDAKATHFFYFYDETGILVINNGNPFYTSSDKNEKSGELKRFLYKNKSDKSTQQDSIGKYGQGSKLLYDFFAKNFTEQHGHEKALEKSLIEQHEGPVLFSWNKLTHIENITQTAFQSLTPASDFEDIDYPLLTRVIYTYYPAMPKEQQKTIISPDIAVPLFDENHFTAFQHTLKKVLQQYNIKPYLNQGTILFIPNSEQLCKKMQEKYNADFLNEAEISLYFLNNLKVIQLNEHYLTRKQNKFQVIPIDKATQMLFPVYPNTLPKNIPSLYKYFPIYNEKYNLPCVIHCSEFSTTADRQNLDAEKPGDVSLDNVLEKLKITLTDLAKNCAPEYLNFLRLFVHTQQPADEKAEQFYEVLYEIAENHIPAEDGKLYPKENICIRPEQHASQIKPADIGLPLYFLPENDAELYQKCIEKFDIQQYSVADLVCKADIQKVQQYLAKRSSQQYLAFLQDIDKDIHRIMDYKIFYDTNKNFYTLNQIMNGNSSVFLLTPVLLLLQNILQKSNAILCTAVLQNTNTYSKLICTVERDKKQLFEKIIRVLDAEKLNHEDKWTLFDVIQKNFNKEQQQEFAKIRLFRNTLGELVPLNSLIQGYDFQVPELTAKFRLHATEPYYKDFEPYLMQNKNLLKHIHDNWDSIKMLILQKNKNTLTQLAPKLYTELIALSQISSTRKNLELNCLIDINGNFTHAKKVFFHEKIVQLSEKEYAELAHTLQKYNNQYTFLPHRDIAIIAQNKSIFGIQNTALKNITDAITVPCFEVSYEYISVFYSLYSDNFLNYFYVKEQNNAYLLCLKTKNITQYYAENALLKDFLNTTGEYVLLPENLVSLFKNDALLKCENEAFCIELINKYGEQPKLIDFILQQSYQVKVLYFQKVKRLDLYTTQDYIKDSYEIKFFQLCQSIDKLNELKNTTYIDGKPIHEYEYANVVVLNTHKFELYQLIPEYEAKTKNLDIMREKWRSLVKDTGNFFENNNQFQPEQVIQYWQINSQKCSTPYQFVFLLLYAKSKNNGWLPHNCINVYPPANETEKIRYWIPLAEMAKEYKFYDFEKILEQNNLSVFTLPCRNYFWLQQKENEKYILPQEILPESVQQWAEQDKKNTEFLHNAGVYQDNSAVISLRKKLLQDTNQKDLEQDFNAVCTSNLLFIQNTFLYLEKQAVQYHSTIQEFIELYIKQYQQIPSHAVYYENWKDDRFEYKYEKFSPNNEVYVYSKQYGKEKAFNSVAIQFKQKQKNRNIIAADNSTTEKFFEKQGIRKLNIRTEFIIPASSSVKEWDSFAYHECKKEGLLQKKIYLTSEPLQYKFYVFEEYVQQGEFDNVYYDEKTQILYIYPGAYNGKTILQILNDYKNSRCITEQELLALFSKADISDEERKKLVITQNYSPEQLQEAIQNYTAQQNKLLENTSGSGNVQVEESKKDIIQKLAQTFTADDLEKLLALQGLDLNNLTERKNKNKNKKENEDEEDENAIINKVTGTIGEIIALEWYKSKYPNYEIIHADTNAYDIEIKNPQGKIVDYVEVKTTSKPLFSQDGKMEKFYSRDAQIAFILSKDYDKYTMFRLSIDGLPELNFRYEYNQLHEFVEFEQIKNSLIEQTRKVCTAEFLKKVEDKFILLEIVPPEKVK